MLPLSFIVGVLCLIVNFEDAKGVINGQKAYQGEFPFIAGIWRLEKFKCGGSIINEFHILTAAHCIIIAAEMDYSVTVGTVNLRSEWAIRFGVNTFYPHPKYRRLLNLDYPTLRNVRNDIAIIKIIGELEWSPYVQPIPLNRECENITCNCFVAGWGAITKGFKPAVAEMRWARLFVMKLEACLKWKLTNLFEACAANPLTFASIGPGDSGGPFICSGRVIGVLIGSKVHEHGPTVYLQVQPYLSFIDEVLSLTPRPPQPTPSVFEFLNQQGLLCT